MGVILTLAIILWICQSGIEYKIVKSNDWAKRNFHGVKGMIISAAISAVVGVVTGATMGVVGGTAAAIAGIAGLFTNDFTFKLFSGLEAGNNKRKEVQHKIHVVKAHKAKHPILWRNASGSLRWGFKTIAAIATLIVFVIGIPGWLCENVFKGSKSLTARIRTS